MARERINLVPEQKLREEEIRYKIETGVMTSETYQSLTPEEQNMVKKVLFEMHSNPVVPPAAFSALEFTAFGLAKLFFRVMSGEPLTAQEQAFYDRFEQFVNQHEITLDAGDWYVPYAEEAMLAAKDNRALYKQRKINITGTF